MKAINEIDRLVGQRLRERRRALRMTQTQLADILQVSFQQVQKYEKGVNRISASRLLHLSQTLRVRPAYFFDRAVDETDDAESLQRLLQDNPDCRDLTASFRRISDANTRHAIIEFVRRLGDAYTEADSALPPRAVAASFAE